MKFTDITQDKINYVLAHLEEKPRKVIAKEVGITLDNLYAILHKNNINLERKKEKLSFM